MPTPYEEAPQDVFNYLLDWQEMIAEEQPGGGQTAGRDGQEAVLVGYIPANKIRSAKRFFLGFSYCDEGDPYRLYREHPHPHPEAPHLRCYDFNAQKIGPAGVPGNTDNGPYVLSPFGGQPDDPGEEEPAALPTESTGYTPGFFFGQPMFTGNYQIAVVTLKYKSWGRMKFIEDADVHGGGSQGAAGDADIEWLRYTDTTTVPRLELLQAEGTGSSLKWVHGPNGAEPRATQDDPAAAGDNAPAGLEIPYPVAERKTVTHYMMRWCFVPHEYISEYFQVLHPTKILNCVGKVNSKLFLGVFPPGTILMEAPTFEPVEFPVTADNPYQSLTGYHVLLNFFHFDPPPGYLPGENMEYRGWNLLPYRGTGSESDDPDAVGKWFYATRDGKEDGRPAIPFADLMQVFDHVLKPPPDDPDEDVLPEVGEEPEDIGGELVAEFPADEG